MSNVGGMQRVAQGLHAALARRADVDMTALLLETSWEATGRRMPGFMARLLAQIPVRVARTRPDVVLFSSMVTAGLSPALRPVVAPFGARLAAIPVGRDVTLPVPIHQWWLRPVFRALDHVFPISEATAAECLARGATPAQTHVIPCGVDPALFTPPPDRRAARRALLEAVGAPEIPDDALLLVSIGRHQERKGFHWFAEEVLPHLPPDVYFLLGGEGPMTERIRTALAAPGLHGRARMLGKMSEETLGLLYRGGDLFVMPNIHVPGDIEGFGVVMLEAGLCGAPIVAADLEGISGVVAEGENGHLVPSGDVAAFTDTILRYRGQRAALAAFAVRASAHTAQQFSWDAVAAQFVDALQRPAPQTSALVRPLAR